MVLADEKDIAIQVTFKSCLGKMIVILMPKLQWECPPCVKNKEEDLEPPQQTVER